MMFTYILAAIWLTWAAGWQSAYGMSGAGVNLPTTYQSINSYPQWLSEIGRKKICLESIGTKRRNLSDRLAQWFSGDALGSCSVNGAATATPIPSPFSFPNTERRYRKKTNVGTVQAIEVAVTPVAVQALQTVSKLRCTAALLQKAQSVALQASDSGSRPVVANHRGMDCVTGHQQ